MTDRDRERSLRAQAYADGELDAATSLAVEGEMQRDDALRHEADAGRRLSAAIHDRATRFAAPNALRARVAPPRRTRRERWFPIAAALAAGVMLGWAIAMFAPAANGDRRIVDDVVSSHVRSLLASHLTDVASSDQHVVKPWLGGQLDFAPPVRDFSDAGFTLVGARLDYVGGRKVAAIVYRHRQHFINVFVWPERDAAIVANRTERGFNVTRVAADGMAFWLVSDVSAAELDRLVGMLSGTASR